MRNTGKLTCKPILPTLIEVVRLFGQIRYDDAADLLIGEGVWSADDLPATPYNTVNACLNMSRDSTGPIFRRVEQGVYELENPSLYA